MGKSTLVGLILCGLVLVISAPLFLDFWRSDFVSSWDGPGHLGLIGHASTDSFPHLHGVIREWFLGMPFPLYYPPLFHYFMTGLEQWTGIDALVWIKIFLSLAIIVLPWQISRIARLAFGGDFLASIAAGGFALYQVTNFDKGGDFGTGLQALLETGLYSQIFTLPAWLLWIECFLFRSHTKLGAALSIVTLTIIFLTNPHVVLISSILFLTGSIHIWHSAKFNMWPPKKRALHFLSLGAIPLTIAMCWYWPMLRQHAWFPTRQLTSLEINYLVVSWSTLLTLAAIGGWTSWKIRPDARALSAFLLLLFVLVNMPKGGPLQFLPIQPFRLAGAIYLLATIPAGAGAAWICHNTLPKHPYRALILLSLPLIIFHRNESDNVSYLNLASMGDTHRILRDIDGVDQMRLMIEPVRDRDNRKTPKRLIIQGNAGDPNPDADLAGNRIIERVKPGILMNESNILTTKLSLKGAEIVNSIFRESSLFSFFAIPTRNALSQFNEEFGIDSYLNRDVAFHRQQWSMGVERARSLGVTHVLTHSYTMDKSMPSLAGISLDKSWDNWKLWKISNPATRIAIANSIPVLVVGSWNPKNRLPGDYDQLRFTEELCLFNRDDIYPIAAQSTIIEDVLPNADVKTILLLQWDYLDDQAAQRHILEHLYAGGSIIASQKSDDTVSDWLSRIDNPKVKMVSIGPFPGLSNDPDWPAESTFRAQHHISSKIIGYLDDFQSPIQSRDVDLSWIDTRTLQINLDKGSRVPILVKYAWHPYWKASSGEQVHRSNRHLMLVYASGPTTLRFTRDPVDDWGLWISLFGMCWGIIYLYQFKESI